MNSKTWLTNPTLRMALVVGLSFPLACDSGGDGSDGEESSDSSADASESQEAGEGESGDGDGDSTTTSATGDGDGDGDTTTGDGDGDGDTTGDGDGDGDTCPAQADTDSMCAVIDGVRRDFYFVESSNVNDRWKAWTDDADENERDSIRLTGANVTVVETLDCANPSPPIVSVTLREDDLGNTGLTQQWMANTMQENGICTIDVTQSAQVVDDKYMGTFSGVLFNSSNGTTKTVSGVFNNTLR